MLIDYRVISHKEQRYNSCGDYWWEGEILHIRVSDVGNERYHFLIFRHELDEAMLCKFANIPEPVCLAYDVAFEEQRSHGDEGYYKEPGNSPLAPYYEQHQIAEVTERFLAQAMRINYEHYCWMFDELGKP